MKCRGLVFSDPRYSARKIPYHRIQRSWRRLRVFRVVGIRKARSVSSLKKKYFPFGFLLRDELCGSQISSREEDKECNNNRKVSSA